MKIIIVKIRNFVLFVILALWNGTPFRLWRMAWILIQADHEASTHKAIYELRVAGKIRKDEQGRLWSVKE